MKKSNKIVNRECRFVVHIPKNEQREDYHLVKELLHYEDGSTKPNLRLLKNYKRPFWVTRKDKRRHKQKREWDEVSNLTKHESTQSDLQINVSRALGMPWSKLHLKRLTGENPYIYGTDINSRVFIKEKYTRNYKGTPTPYSVATLDIETDVLNDSDDPIIISISFKNETKLFVTEDFCKGIHNLEHRYQAAVDKYLKEYKDKREQVFTVEVCDGPLEIIRAAFKVVHHWEPDFLAIWNINFDIPRILKTIKKYGADPAEILCDPRIPRNLWVCEYIPGRSTRSKADGSTFTVDFSEQWHHFDLTASFHFIDAMCVYRQIRMHEQKRSSYGLDSVLDDELGVRKLNFTKADRYIKLKWHQFMQENYKVEYMVYAAFDSLSMIELDEKTKDLSMKLPSNAGSTDFEIFRSQPTRIVNALFFFALDRGHVLGTAVDGDGGVVYYEDEEDDFMGDTETLGRDNWILTLPAHLSVLGMRVIEEDPNLRSNIRGFTYDSDAVSAYPTAGSISNQSKSTTSKELVAIEGVEELTFRMQNLNIILGNVNAVEYATHMFKAPELDELLDFL